MMYYAKFNAYGSLQIKFGDGQKYRTQWSFYLTTNINRRKISRKIREDKEGHDYPKQTPTKTRFKEGYFKPDRYLPIKVKSKAD